MSFDQFLYSSSATNLIVGVDIDNFEFDWVYKIEGNILYMTKFNDFMVAHLDCKFFLK